MKYVYSQDALYTCNDKYTMGHLTIRSDVTSGQFHLPCGTGGTYPSSPNWVTCLPLCATNPVTVKKKHFWMFENQLIVNTPSKHIFVFPIKLLFCLMFVKLHFNFHNMRFHNVYK
jgi:hypothetical protein